MGNVRCSMHCNVFDEFSCELNEGLHGNVYITICEDTTLFLTPEQAAQVAKEITDGLARIAVEKKKRAELYKRNPQMCKAQADMTDEELKEAIGW